MKYFPYFLSLLFAAGLIIAAPMVQAEGATTDAASSDSDADAIEAIDEGPCAGMIDRRKQLCRLKHKVGQKPATKAFRNALREDRSFGRRVGRFNNRIDRAFKMRQQTYKRTIDIHGRRADRLKRLSQMTDQAGLPGLSNRLGKLSNRVIRVSDRTSARAATKSIRGDRETSRMARTRARVNRGRGFGIPNVLVTPYSTTTVDN